MIDLETQKDILGFVSHDMGMETISTTSLVQVVQYYTGSSGNWFDFMDLGLFDKGQNTCLYNDEYALSKKGRALLNEVGK